MLERKEVDVQKARDKVKAFRKSLAKRTDKKNQFTLRKEARLINPGDLVLLYDARRQIDKSRISKLQMRWLGPYRVTSQNKNSGAY